MVDGGQRFKSSALILVLDWVTTTGRRSIL